MSTNMIGASRCLIAGCDRDATAVGYCEAHFPRLDLSERLVPRSVLGPPAGDRQGSLLRRADELINGERAKQYGPATESFARAGRIVGACLTSGEREALGSGAVPATVIAKVLLALKLVRESYTPGNPDHLLDAAGYLGLLDQVKGAK